MPKMNGLNRPALRRRKHPRPTAEKSILDLSRNLALQRKVTGDDQQHGS
jgi:hypothetical protein